MKCNQCGYCDNGSGDMAHVCMPVIPRPSNHEVEMNRLKRKMNKIKDQRDKTRVELAHYRSVLKELPYLQKRYDLYMEMKKQEELIRTLQVRVKEQSMLIGSLTNG